MSLRIIFAGTPDIAARSLAALIDSEHEVVAVYTQPDRPAGRGRKLKPSPVKMLAEVENIPVHQPQTLRDTDEQEIIKSYQADVMVVLAYGLILPKTVLDTPVYGCINAHASLLPRWRGAAPIQRAIEAGDAQTGITIMQMDEGMDTGAMLHKATCMIAEDETSESLYDRLGEMAAQEILATLSNLMLIEPEVQDNDKATYANKITKAEGKINWSQSAIEIERKIRAFYPWPMTFFELGGQVIKIHQASIMNFSLSLEGSSDGSSDGSEENMHVKLDDAEGVSIESFNNSGESSFDEGQIVFAEKCGIAVATGDGILLVQKLQLPGGKPLEAAQILNSKSEMFGAGEILK